MYGGDSEAGLGKCTRWGVSNGYKLIEIKSDGSWSYHAPNGDIVQVRADGSWEQTGENGVIEVEANGTWEQTGGNGAIEVPSVPLKPADATVDPVKPVTPRR